MNEPRSRVVPGVSPVLRRRLRLAGLLLGTGLAIEAGTILWSHPATFVAFIVFGGLLVGAGVLTYLWALLS